MMVHTTHLSTQGHEQMLVGEEGLSSTERGRKLFFLFQVLVQEVITHVFNPLSL